MKISMRGNAGLLNSFDYAKELDSELNVSRPITLANALNYVVANPDINFSQVQKFRVKQYERENITENISIEVDDFLFNKVRLIIQDNFPTVKIQYPFTCRMALNAYIMSLLNNSVKDVDESIKILINKNQNLRWAQDNKIKYDEIIVDNPHIRGVYGIFVEDECVYIGRASSLYARIFMGDCHILRIRNKTHIPKVIEAIKEGKSIEFNVIEEIKIIGDHPAKDAQRLASGECYWIDFYQAKDQCLEQYPEGRWT